MKAVTGRRIVAVQPDAAGGLQQVVRADDVGVDEGAGADDRAVDVGLGREMHDRVDLLLAQQRLDRLPIDDIAFDESILLVARNGLAGWRDCRRR